MIEWFVDNWEILAGVVTGITALLGTGMVLRIRKKSQSQRVSGDGIAIQAGRDVNIDRKAKSKG